MTTMSVKDGKVYLSGTCDINGKRHSMACTGVYCAEVCTDGNHSSSGVTHYSCNYGACCGTKCLTCGKWR